MRATLPCSALLLAAGCAGPPSDPSAETAAGASMGPGMAAGAGNASYEAVTLYHFADLVAGASAPDPQGPGAAADPIPLAKTDAFEVPNGTARLSFVSHIYTGTGSSRIEVLAPDGLLAYSTDTHHDVGAPDGPSAGLRTPSETQADTPAPGTYTVNDHAAGAKRAVLEVTGQRAIQPYGASFRFMSRTASAGASTAPASR